MASFKCLFSVAIFCLASFLFFNCCDADKALIDSICKESQDYDFCTSTINNHAGSPTADLRGLALIAASQTVSQIQDTLDRIPTILKQVQDPLGKQRLGDCQTDYNTSLGKFQSAFGSTSNKAYWDALSFVRDGTNIVIDCHNSYRRDGPTATSPIAEDDTKVFKLSEIILIIVDRLI
ncbi:Plant invertase/pectin methylesterase inhibitor superfamily protein, putative [Theobroma cacao]|uniref:Plant invertase/pectin methylesterase inhibitor superfamily protein, putative n=1 Tax=Theobroma cacao TaxID=3641 RepID=A0A061DRM6_THECC|nr:Plant invertase/pectin methylesterase inhibitor superfamily protein, putative [Theobroma cacao]